jgi:hypothetical protein
MLIAKRIDTNLAASRTLLGISSDGGTKTRKTVDGITAAFAIGACHWFRRQIKANPAYKSFLERGGSLAQLR